jgi:hypothetical protein
VFNLNPLDVSIVDSKAFVQGARRALYATTGLADLASHLALGTNQRIAQQWYLQCEVGQSNQEATWDLFKMTRY